MRVIYSMIIILLISTNLWFVREPATISKVVVVDDYRRVTTGEYPYRRGTLDGVPVRLPKRCSSTNEVFVWTLWLDEHYVDRKFLYIFEGRTDGKLYAVDAIEINPVPAEIREDMIKILTGKPLVG